MELLRNWKHIGLFEMMRPGLEGIRCLVPMPNEWRYTQKVIEKKMLCCIKHFVLPFCSAEPGVGFCLDSRSHKNGGLCACMALFIRN